MLTLIKARASKGATAAVPTAMARLALFSAVWVAGAPVPVRVADAEVEVVMYRSASLPFRRRALR